DNEEPGQPDRPAPALDAHAVHAVVPVTASHQRKPVLPLRAAARYGPQAVLQDRTVPCRLVMVVALVLVGPKGCSCEEGGLLVQHAAIAGHLHVPGGDERQPQQVVGYARSYAATARRVPPVQHVALQELVGGRRHYLLARQL